MGSAGYDMKPIEGPVIGLGNALVDVVAMVEHDAITRHALTHGAMHLVGRSESDALYAEVGPGLRQSGGSVANTIAHIRSLGLDCGYIGKVADDELGAVFRADLDTLGVRFATPLHDGGAGDGTGRCVVLVTPDGERTMSTYLGAAQGVTQHDVDAALDAAPGLLIVEGYLWDSPEGGAAINAAAARTKDAGGLIALTPSDAGCVGRNRKAMLNFVTEYCDILIGNETEMNALSGMSTACHALDWACIHVGIAAVTMSEKGAMVANADEGAMIPALPVTKVVDSTGAGDAFAAGFLGGLVRGHSLTEAGHAGAALAATVITHPGARQASAEPAKA